MRYRLLPRAIVDIDEISAYIARDSWESAARFYEIVDEAIALLLSMPEAGAIEDTQLKKFGEVRRIALKWEKYQLFYAHEKDLVVVLRVVRGARDRREIFREYQ